MTARSYDYVLAGGGLQSGLLVLALRYMQPDARIAVIERGPRLGGNHTWCFHHEDLSPTAREWTASLVRCRWPGYTVQFPGLERRIEHSYSAVSDGSLHLAVAGALDAAPGCDLFLDSTVDGMDAERVLTTKGKEIRGRVVLDARGGEGELASHCGYQKFVGLELELERPHGLAVPLLMDATVEQTEGFRFLYLLPFSPTRVLVEDTCFADGPNMEAEALRHAIARYVEARGWSVAEEVREELGVLPMPWRSPPLRVDTGPLSVGTRGGWFHPATGYSFPVAARLAEAIARLSPDSLFDGDLLKLAREHERQSRFARLLNRLLFSWYPPSARRGIFERFYRMPEETISRFYALQTTAVDQARLLLGNPPPGLSLRHHLKSGGHA